MKRLLLLISAGYCFSGTAQVIYPYRVCASPAVLKEFSGIAWLGDDKLAGINDGGNSSSVYFMDTTGKLLKTRTFKSIANTDWEELFYRNKKLYIADVGDNLCQRKKLTVYEYDLAKDTITARTDFGFAEKNKSRLSEKDKHYDCEAGFALDNSFYFFSKAHAKPYTGKSVQYKIEPGRPYKEYTGMDSANMGNKGFIHNSLTGAALSPSENLVAFISCTHLWVRCMPVADAYLRTGWLMDFEIEGLTQKEAVTFISEHRLVVADERTLGFMGGRLYFYDIGAYLKGNKRYARPSVKNAVMKQKKGSYHFSFEASVPMNEITVAWADKRGEIIYSSQLTLIKNKVDKELRLDLHGTNRPVAFWVMEKNNILFTSKITK